MGEVVGLDGKPLSEQSSLVGPDGQPIKSEQNMEEMWRKLKEQEVESKRTIQAIMAKEVITKNDRKELFGRLYSLNTILRTYVNGLFQDLTNLIQQNEMTKAYIGFQEQRAISLVRLLLAKGLVTEAELNAEMETVNKEFTQQIEALHEPCATEPDIVTEPPSA